jgi:flavorubredoxin
MRIPASSDASSPDGVRHAHPRGRYAADFPPFDPTRGGSMPRVLIVFASRTGESEQIAELIGEGLRMSGAEAVAKNVKDIRKIEDIAGYDGYVFGSSTYHGEMMEKMKTLLFLAEQADLKGKVGAAFGAFGWSGEAPGRIFETMEHVFGMDMVGGPLMLKSASLGGGISMAQEYGKEIAAKLGV